MCGLRILLAGLAQNIPIWVAGAGRSIGAWSGTNAVRRPARTGSTWSPAV